MRPLIEYIYPIAFTQPKGLLARIDSALRKTFKQFTGLRMSIDTELIEHLFGHVPLYALNKSENTDSKIKWNIEK